MSRRGERSIDLADLFVGYYQSAVARDELITQIEIPPQPPGVHTWYAKFSALSADDWPSVGVAVWYRAEGDRITEARVAVSAATERPVRVAGAEAALAGAAATAETLCGGGRCSRPGDRAALRHPRQRRLQARNGAGAYAPRAEQRVAGLGKERTGMSVGQSVRRLEGHAKVTGTADTSITCACPGCSPARSTGVPCRTDASCGSIRAPRSRSPACTRSSPSTTCWRSRPVRTTVRRFTISRSWRTGKSGTSASRSRSCWRQTRTLPKKPRT